MAVLRMDGIDVDTAVWIEPRLAAFMRREEFWGVRRKKIEQEIAAYETVLKKYCEPRQTPDPRGIAHTKAYLYLLKQARRNILTEFLTFFQKIVFSHRNDTQEIGYRC
ncbi:MAG TPA: hypothetical protein VH079_15345 [Terriglobales bacterium]|jgi:hypothetical protein|nr:hypothetical protein [Terriglobales bacterium]